jgi:hypothetical protein
MSKLTTGQIRVWFLYFWQEGCGVSLPNTVHDRGGGQALCKLSLTQQLYFVGEVSLLWLLDFVILECSELSDAVLIPR